MEELFIIGNTTFIVKDNRLNEEQNIKDKIVGTEVSIDMTRILNKPITEPIQKWRYRAPQKKMWLMKNWSIFLIRLNNLRVYYLCLRRASGR